MMKLSKKWIEENVAKIKSKGGIRNIKKRILSRDKKKYYANLSDEAKKRIELRRWWRPFTIKLSADYKVYCIAFYKYNRKRYDRINYEARTNSILRHNYAKFY